MVETTSPPPQQQIQEATTPEGVAQAVLMKTMEDIVTVLCGPGGGKSHLYEDVLAMVEQSLFTIALRRNNFIKSRAAEYLGMNRNTFQKKIAKYGLDEAT